MNPLVVSIAIILIVLILAFFICPMSNAYDGFRGRRGRRGRGRRFFRRSWGRRHWNIPTWTVPIWNVPRWSNLYYYEPDYLGKCTNLCNKTFYPPTNENVPERAKCIQACYSSTKY